MESWFNKGWGIKTPLKWKLRRLKYLLKRELKVKSFKTRYNEYKVRKIIKEVKQKLDSCPNIRYKVVYHKRNEYDRINNMTKTIRIYIRNNKTRELPRGFLWDILDLIHPVLNTEKLVMKPYTVMRYGENGLEPDYVRLNTYIHLEN